MDTTRKLLLAVVVILVLLVLMGNIKLMRARAADEEAARATEAAMAFDSGLYYDRLPLTKPHHMGVYEIRERVEGPPIPIVNYTSVPWEHGSVLKPGEDPSLIVIDRKVPGEGSVSTPSGDPLIITGGPPVERSGAEADLAERAGIDASTILATSEEIDAQEQMKENIRIARLATSNPEIAQYENQLIGEENFIKSLPVSNQCIDFNPEQCAQWKANNECVINPEFMLFNCPSACNACDMSEGQKNLLSTIYNERDPINCVSHGGYNIPGAEDYFN